MGAPVFFLNPDLRILDLIRDGDEKALLQLFEMNRKAVSSFVTRNHGTPSDAEDMLQEAVIVLWERVRAGRFEYSSKLSTFIFSVVKHMWLRRLSHHTRVPPVTIDTELLPSPDNSILDDLIAAEESARLHSAMEKLGETCRKLLIMYYWEECSLDTIARRMGFANAQTAKSKKYQCKEVLRQLLEEVH